MARVSGLLLAAGAGTRFGRPKALVVEGGRSWLEAGARMLLDAGCSDVVVVLGAAAEAARRLVPADPRLTAVVAADWADGLSASLRAGLAALAGPVGAARDGAGDASPTAGTVEAALVSLVDLPGLPPTVGARVIAAAATTAGGLPDALARATFDGRPGHPVLLGRTHWAPLVAGLSGDRGAGPYLAAHGGLDVECGDLASGEDRDR